MDYKITVETEKYFASIIFGLTLIFFDVNAKDMVNSFKSKKIIKKYTTIRHLYIMLLRNRDLFGYTISYRTIGKTISRVNSAIRSNYEFAKEKYNRLTWFRDDYIRYQKFILSVMKSMQTLNKYIKAQDQSNENVLMIKNILNKYNEFIQIFNSNLHSYNFILGLL